MDAPFLMQLLNVLVACIVGSDLLLDDQTASLSETGIVSRFVKYQRVLAVWFVANAVYLAAYVTSFSALLGRVSAVATFLHGAIQHSIGHCFVLSLLFAALTVALPIAYRLRHTDDAPPAKQWASATAVLSALYWIVLKASGIHEWVEAGVSSRLLVIVLAYVAACHWDVKRRAPKLSRHVFVAELVMATAQTILMLPLVSMAVAFGFLMVLAVMQGLGLNPEWLNWPIYYSVLYGPWSGVYVITKARCLRKRRTTNARKTRSRKILPS